MICLDVLMFSNYGRVHTYLVAQSHPTLCDPIDCSPPGSSVHGDSPGKNNRVGCHALLQGSSQPRNWTQVSCIAGRFFTIWATREVQKWWKQKSNLGPRKRGKQMVTGREKMRWGIKPFRVFSGYLYSSYDTLLILLSYSLDRLSFSHRYKLQGGFPSGSGKEFICQCRRLGFNPWVKKIPLEEEMSAYISILPGKSHGQRSLAGNNPRGCKESDTIEGLSMHVLSSRTTGSPDAFPPADTKLNSKSLLNYNCFLFLKVIFLSPFECIYLWKVQHLWFYQGLLQGGIEGCSEDKVWWG